jgi:multiple inositol-polyphosphate phosphatase/2,3-bisphosphoglycerate 3-phosphatase
MPEMQDYELIPWVSCTSWVKTAFSNNSYFNEQRYIYGNKTLAPIAERISKEYGVSPPLDPFLVPFIFTHCQFYVAAYNRTDTWCTLLKPDELTLIRYYWDMRVYYILQYGHPFNKRVSCAYITRLVNGVDSYLNGTSPVIADLTFSHSYTMLFIFTSLGLLKEKQPLTADLTFEQIKKVKKTEFGSIHWSSTLYFEIYTCPEGKASIRAVLNYKPLPIPGCGGEYCDWKRFKELFGHLVGCDPQKLCAYP